jgi:putative flippase GtrA
MVAIFRLARRMLADQKMRFLIVGGVNTVVGFLTFSAIQYFFGQNVGYLGSLFISHFLVSIAAFTLYRRYVFVVKGKLLMDFLRFQGVYMVSLGANALLLPILVAGFYWNVYVAQASSIVIVTIVSFVGHKYFSFRRAASIEGDSPQSN